MDRPEARADLDRGQAIPVLLLLVGVVASLAIATASFGAQLVAGERAATAADSAALAGVVHGRGAAAAVAIANGARLVGWKAQPGPHGGTLEVVVTVECDGPLGSVSAVARALSP